MGVLSQAWAPARGKPEETWLAWQGLADFSYKPRATAATAG